MVKLRVGIPLLALLLVAAPGLPQAATLQFVKVKSTGAKHEYTFHGRFNYDFDKIAETVRMDIEGTYDGSSALAKEVDTFYGRHGKEIFTTVWKCADDPWLNAKSVCSQVTSSEATSTGGYYMGTFCPGYFEGHWCLAGRGLVPQSIASLMRHGPPAPKVSGPTQAASNHDVTLRTLYSKGLANRLWIQQWYCPPGKDGAPTDTPTDTEPFGGACTSTVHGPLNIPKEDVAGIAFPMAYPKNSPKIGFWYVRTRISSNNYGDSVWGHWHRTVVSISATSKPVGTRGLRANRGPVNTTINMKNIIKGAKPPVITEPAEGQVFHGAPINLSANVSPHEPNSVWACCEIQWKRAVILTQENKAYAQAYTPGQTAFPTPPSPWHITSMMGFATDVKEAGTSLHGSLFYNQLRPHDLTFGYQYWFRMREDYYPGGLQETRYPGPYSAWRSFVVQAPASSPTLIRPMHVQPGAGTGKQQNSRQQRSSQKLAPMPMMRVR
jgi:hypothetical protein